MDANQDNNWTVVGVWVGDSPVPVGVIRGAHDVEGGDESEFPDGLWATTVQASDAADAESVAVAEMSGEDEDDSAEDDRAVEAVLSAVDDWHEQQQADRS